MAVGAGWAARRGGTARPGRCRCRPAPASSRAPPEAEDGVDLAMAAGLGGVTVGLGIHHGLARAVGRAHDAAVPGGVVQHRGDHRGGTAVAGVGGDEVADGLGGHERHVAAQDDHGRIGVDVPGGRAHGTAGAVGHGLHGEQHAVGEMALQRAIGAADDDHPGGAGLQGGCHGPADHRPSADLVEHLRGARTHPGSLSCGHHDDDGGDAHAPHRSHNPLSGGRCTPSCAARCGSRRPDRPTRPARCGRSGCSSSRSSCRRTSSSR